MWLLLQSLVIFAVVGTNIHWHWTENIYLPAILGFVAALLLTVGPNGLLDLLRRQKRPLMRFACFGPLGQENESTARAESAKD